MNWFTIYCPAGWSKRRFRQWSHQRFLTRRFGVFEHLDEYFSPPRLHVYHYTTF